MNGGYPPSENGYDFAIITPIRVTESDLTIVSESEG